MNSPKFTPPNLSEILTAAFAASPGDSRIHYGFAKNPDDKWFSRNQEGVKAAQRIVDDWCENLDLSEFVKEASAKEVGDDLLEALRDRIRGSADKSLPELIAAVLRGEWARKMIMLCPTVRPVQPLVSWTQKAMLRKAPWLGYDQETNVLIKARNILANRFVASEAEWSLWLDDDTIMPFGSPEFFYRYLNADPQYIKTEFLRFHAADKLRSRNKTIISGVVGDKSHSGLLMIQPEVSPRNEADKEFVNELKASGPRDEVKQVEWCGAGCLLVHRSVYVSIMEAFPERNHPNLGFNFFSRGDATGWSEGEDVSFCELAKATGHTCWLDLAVWCAHIGTHSYIPQRPRAGVRTGK